MKPDAETIIARYLAVRDGHPRQYALERYHAEGAALLRELRVGGYSLIYGADHVFIPKAEE